MLRERAVGESLWESVLPAELRELPAELGKVDAILDDDRFLAPFRSRLTARIGRPTIPIETYVRLMYLKHRYALGYETLCKEVADSFTWRRFCRIGIDGRVPDPTTLMKLTKRLGPGLLEELNAELLALAVERKVLRSRRLRVDTTVVEADIRSPTDSGLCAHAVSRLTRLARRIKAAGLAPNARLRDRRRSVGERVRAISAARVFARRELSTIDRLSAEIAERAKQTVRRVECARGREAARVRRGCPRRQGVPDEWAQVEQPGARRGELTPRAAKGRSGAAARRARSPTPLLRFDQRQALQHIICRRRPLENLG
jgi:IS5 family transposase